ncbi:hypothetical protein MHY85_02285 [Cellulomonas sp. ACRRI]|uniref:hypothetical protein n=1 Tax=Cellulomonas sp. ACRRI TaxID=2918188 RepID=UPI001EF1EAB1|nr:hypothetical protein [Cellulomonas sp. ACRRI]MCG7284800.1 hypothetical protein [Cellulomonas sp. ACRRI]
MTVELLRAIGYVAGQLIALLSAMTVGVYITARAWRSDARRARWSEHGLSATELAELHPLTFLAVVSASNRPDAARLAEGLGRGWTRTKRTLVAIPWTVTAFIAGLALTYACRHLTATGLTFVWAATMITLAAIAGGLWVGLGCMFLYDYLLVRISPLRGADIAVGIALALKPVPQGGSRHLRRSSRARASQRVTDAFSRLKLPMAEVVARERRALDDAGWAEFQEMSARLLGRVYEGDFVGHRTTEEPSQGRRTGWKALWTVVVALGAIPVAISQLHEIVVAIADLGAQFP